MFTLYRRGYSVKRKVCVWLTLCGGIWILSVLISLIYVWITKGIPIDDALMVNYAVSIFRSCIYGDFHSVQLKVRK